MWAEVKHLQIKMLLKHFIGTLSKNIYIYIYMWSQSANVQKLWIHDLLDALKNNNK